MQEVHKVYTQPFLLEPTKLTRLMEVIHARIKERAGVNSHDRFEVFMNDARQERTDSLEAVLALDNSSRLLKKQLLRMVQRNKSE